jgi:hypothetical protein
VDVVGGEAVIVVVLTNPGALVDAEVTLTEVMDEKDALVALLNTTLPLPVT